MHIYSNMCVQVYLFSIPEAVIRSLLIGNQIDLNPPKKTFSHPQQLGKMFG